MSVAGSLDFRLGLNNAQYVASADQAIRQNIRLTTSAAGIRAAFSAAGPAIMQPAISLHQLSAGARTATAGLHALEGGLTLIGGTIAPQFTGAILTITSAFHAMKAAATAAGVTIAAVVAPIAVLVIVVLALAAAFKKLATEYGGMLNRIAERRGLEALQAQIPNTVRVLQQAAQERRISPQEYDQTVARLSQAQTTADLAREFQAANRLAGRGRDQDSEEILQRRNEFQLRQQEVQARGLANDFERRRQLATIQARRDILQIGDEAQRARVSPREAQLEREVQLRRELQEIDDDERRQNSPPSQTWRDRLRRPELTPLERIGLVLGGRGPGSGRDPDASATATNTRRSADLLQQILREIGTLQPPDFVNQS